jgi:hypothetical protein
MPRYMVQRTFPKGLTIPVSSGGVDSCATVVDRNLSADRRTTFCVYDAPTPEAVRKSASRNELPIDV